MELKLFCGALHEYLDRWIRQAGWYPDAPVYQRSTAQVSTASWSCWARVEPIPWLAPAAIS